MGVEFEFRSVLHATASEMFFKDVANKMVDAFSERCEAAHKSKEYLKISCYDHNNKLDFEELLVSTHFSAIELKELQVLFQDHQNDIDCVDIDTFEDLLGKYFSSIFDKNALEDNNKFARLKSIAPNIFLSCDLDSNDMVDFREFVAGMSTLHKGTLKEKLCFWLRSVENRKRNV